MFGAIGSLVSAMLAAQAQNNATNVDWANLQETKRNNAFNKEQALSTRVDAEGNKLYWDQERQQWTTDPTPTTKKIIDYDQSEQIKQLTQDATQNREASQRKDARSREGDAAFQTSFNDYRYRNKPEEAAYVGKAENSALTSYRSGLDQAAQVLAGQALRTGGPTDFAKVLNSTGDTFARNYANLMAGARSQGQSDYHADTSANDKAMTDELGIYKGIADDTDQLGIDTTNPTAAMSAQQSDALKTLISTITSGTGQLQSANNQLAGDLGKSPTIDLSGLDSMMTNAGNQSNQLKIAGINAQNRLDIANTRGDTALQRLYAQAALKNGGFVNPAVGITSSSIY